MGYKSTIFITKEEAIEQITTTLTEAGDKEIAEALESIMGGQEHGFNYTIVTKEEMKDMEDEEERIIAKIHKENENYQ